MQVTETDVQRHLAAPHDIASRSVADML